MRAARDAMRVLAERLVRRACRRLPEGAREERYREWTAELAAIFEDSDIRFAWCRELGALIFAADQIRGAACMGGRTPPSSSGQPEDQAADTRDHRFGRASITDILEGEPLILEGQWEGGKITAQDWRDGFGGFRLNRKG